MSCQDQAQALVVIMIHHYAALLSTLGNRGHADQKMPAEACHQQYHMHVLAFDLADHTVESKFYHHSLHLV